MSTCQILILFLLIVVVIAILIVVLKRPKNVFPIPPIQSQSSIIPVSKESFAKKGMSHYLNVNSTLATETGQLNASDLGYDEMLEQRRQKLLVFNKIRKLVDAPLNSKVILTSGSTEGIATCINWAKCYNPYGVVAGSEFDHEAVEANAKVRGMEYVKLRKTSDLPGNTSCIFLTHVNSKNGEIIRSNV